MNKKNNDRRNLVETKRNNNLVKRNSCYGFEGEIIFYFNTHKNATFYRSLVKENINSNNCLDDGSGDDVISDNEDDISEITSENEHSESEITESTDQCCTNETNDTASRGTENNESTNYISKSRSRNSRNIVSSHGRKSGEDIDDTSVSVYWSEDVSDDDTESKCFLYKSSSFSSKIKSSYKPKTDKSEEVVNSCQKTSSLCDMSSKSSSSFLASNIFLEPEDSFIQVSLSHENDLQDHVPLASKILSFTTSRLENCRQLIESFKVRIFDGKTEKCKHDSSNKNNTGHARGSLSTTDTVLSNKNRVFVQLTSSDSDVSSATEGHTREGELVAKVKEMLTNPVKGLDKIPYPNSAYAGCNTKSALKDNEQSTEKPNIPKEREGTKLLNDYNDAFKIVRARKAYNEKEGRTFRFGKKKIDIIKPKKIPLNIKFGKAVKNLPSKVNEISAEESPEGSEEEEGSLEEEKTNNSEYNTEQSLEIVLENSKLFPETQEFQSNFEIAVEKTTNKNENEPALELDVVEESTHAKTGLNAQISMQSNDLDSKQDALNEDKNEDKEVKENTNFDEDLVQRFEETNKEEEITENILITEQSICPMVTEGLTTNEQNVDQQLLGESETKKVLPVFVYKDYELQSRASQITKQVPNTCKIHAKSRKNQQESLKRNTKSIDTNPVNQLDSKISEKTNSKTTDPKISHTKQTISNAKNDNTSMNIGNKPLQKKMHSSTNVSDKRNSEVLQASANELQPTLLQFVKRDYSTSSPGLTTRNTNPQTASVKTSPPNSASCSDLYYTVGPKKSSPRTFTEDSHHRVLTPVQSPGNKYYTTSYDSPRLFANSKSQEIWYGSDHILRSNDTKSHDTLQYGDSSAYIGRLNLEEIAGRISKKSDPLYLSNNAEGVQDLTNGTKHTTSSGATMPSIILPCPELVVMEQNKQAVLEDICVSATGNVPCSVPCNVSSINKCIERTDNILLNTRNETYSSGRRSCNIRPVIQHNQASLSHGKNGENSNETVGDETNEAQWNKKTIQEKFITDILSEDIENIFSSTPEFVNYENQHPKNKTKICSEHMKDFEVSKEKLINRKEQKEGINSDSGSKGRQVTGYKTDNRPVTRVHEKESSQPGKEQFGSTSVTPNTSDRSIEYDPYLQCKVALLKFHAQDTSASKIVTTQELSRKKSWTGNLLKDMAKMIDDQHWNSLHANNERLWENGDNENNITYSKPSRSETHDNESINVEKKPQDALTVENSEQNKTKNFKANQNTGSKSCQDCDSREGIIEQYKDTSVQENYYYGNKDYATNSLNFEHEENPKERIKSDPAGKRAVVKKVSKNVTNNSTEVLQPLVEVSGLQYHEFVTRKDFISDSAFGQVEVSGSEDYLVVGKNNRQNEKKRPPADGFKYPCWSDPEQSGFIDEGIQQGLKASIFDMNSLLTDAYMYKVTQCSLKSAINGDEFYWYQGDGKERKASNREPGVGDEGKRTKSTRKQVDFISAENTVQSRKQAISRSVGTQYSNTEVDLDECKDPTRVAPARNERSPGSGYSLNKKVPSTEVNKEIDDHQQHKPELVNKLPKSLPIALNTDRCKPETAISGATEKTKLKKFVTFEENERDLRVEKYKSHLPNENNEKNTECLNIAKERVVMNSRNVRCYTEARKHLENNSDKTKMQGKLERGEQFSKHDHTQNSSKQRPDGKEFTKASIESPIWDHYMSQNRTPKDTKDEDKASSFDILSWKQSLMNKTPKVSDTTQPQIFLQQPMKRGQSLKTYTSKVISKTETEKTKSPTINGATDVRAKCPKKCGNASPHNGQLHFTMKEFIANPTAKLNSNARSMPFVPFYVTETNNIKYPKGQPYKSSLGLEDLDTNEHQEKVRGVVDLSQRQGDSKAYGAIEKTNNWAGNQREVAKEMDSRKVIASGKDRPEENSLKRPWLVDVPRKYANNETSKTMVVSSLTKWSNEYCEMNKRRYLNPSPASPQVHHKTHHMACVNPESTNHVETKDTNKATHIKPSIKEPDGNFELNKTSNLIDSRSFKASDMNRKTSVIVPTGSKESYEISNYHRPISSTAPTEHREMSKRILCHSSFIAQNENREINTKAFFHTSSLAPTENREKNPKLNANSISPVSVETRRNNQWAYANPSEKPPESKVINKRMCLGSSAMDRAESREVKSSRSVSYEDMNREHYIPEVRDSFNYPSSSKPRYSFTDTQMPPASLYLQQYEKDHNANLRLGGNVHQGNGTVSPNRKLFGNFLVTDTGGVNGKDSYTNEGYFIPENDAEEQNEHLRNINLFKQKVPKFSLEPKVIAQPLNDADGRHQENYRNLQSRENYFKKYFSLDNADIQLGRMTPTAYPGTSREHQARF